MKSDTIPWDIKGFIALLMTSLKKYPEASYPCIQKTIVLNKSNVVSKCMDIRKKVHINNK